MTQTERLHEALRDMAWHDTTELVERVYGSQRMTLGRLAARKFDLEKRLPGGWRIDSRPKPESKGTIWQYRLVAPAEDGQQQLFKEGA